MWISAGLQMCTKPAILGFTFQSFLPNANPHPLPGRNVVRDELGEAEVSALPSAPLGSRGTQPPRESLGKGPRGHWQSCSELLSSPHQMSLPGDGEHRVRSLDVDFTFRVGPTQCSPHKSSPFKSLLDTSTTDLLPGGKILFLRDVCKS